jgi:hypothetical protein
MKILKAVAILLIVALAASLTKAWYEIYLVGQYYSKSGLFLAVFVGLMPAFIWAIALGSAIGIVKVKPKAPSMLPLLFLPLVLPNLGCDYAQANVQTLITRNCGVSWEVIKAGETIPKLIGVCSYKVTVPDYPMPGETRFKASFANRVLAGIEVAYEYQIMDAKVFISEAKYLGKPNTDSDDKTNSASAFETAENSVIDKRIREATSTSLIKEDIVDFSQAEYEDALLQAANEMLKTKGVKLNFISFVPTPEEQTRLAIDMVTALKVYDSKGMGALGAQVAVAKAGAPRIAMTATVPQQAPPAD